VVAKKKELRLGILLEAARRSKGEIGLDTPVCGSPLPEKAA
jgi:hypothetical protein